MVADPTESTLIKVQLMQDGLVAFSTGGEFDGGDLTYKRLRRELLDRPDVRDKLPAFVRRYRDLGQFWQFIKQEYGRYAERRQFLWESFRPAIDYLEAFDRAPGLQPIGDVLERFDPEKVHAVWQKALDRRLVDPEGAITAARTLLESVCKHILDEGGIAYAEDADLPKLWALCAEALNLAPHQHQEKLFKAILGNCQSVVNSLGALRNRIGDAHGTGRRAVKPKPRHAELAVNLAGTMAAFLVSTWKEKQSDG
jgi:hypothetical protein